MNDADPRVKRTRKLILDAFVELLKEKGFHAVSVQDIAAKATVNRATFYAHFVDKYGLLDHMVGEWFREVLSQRQLNATPFTINNLRRLIVTVLEAMAEFRGHCVGPHQDLDTSIEARVQRELDGFLRGWFTLLPPGNGRDRVSAETTSSVLSWAIFGAALDWSQNPSATPADERALQIVTLLTRGLGHVLGGAELPRKPANGGIARGALLSDGFDALVPW